MIAKEYLNQIKLLNTNINQLMAELHNYRDYIKRYITATKMINLCAESEVKAIEYNKLHIKGYNDSTIADMLGINAIEVAGLKLYCIQKQNRDRCIKELTDKYNSFSDKIDKQINKFVGKRNEIITKVQSLSDKRYSDVLYKYYVQNKDLHIISNEMGYSYGHTKIIKMQALEALQELII